MLHNTVASSLLNLFCLVEGEGTSNAFPASTDTVDDLKKLIEAENTNINDVDASQLTIWRVSTPVVAANQFARTVK